MADSRRQSRQYYRKPLPQSCIDFASDDGQQIFKEAMNNGDMTCFFNLAAQFRTQEEPAYCGLSTLVMVLNALSVDPGRVWKGPWRWYHENMLDCCVPLSIAEKQGITLFQFSCLAMCNGLDVDMVQVTEMESVEKFRNSIKRISRCDREVLVCSYSRRTLGQTGDGHFSPLGGYHAHRDLVLIFDVARFKYPPHWVPVELLWKAMQGLDKETGKPRGYMILKQTKNTGSPTMLFTVSENLNFTQIPVQKPELSQLLDKWWGWLSKPCDKILGKSQFLEVLVSNFLSIWCIKVFPDYDKLFSLKVDGKSCAQLSQQHRHAICILVNCLEKQQLFQTVKESMESEKYSCNSDCCKSIVSNATVHEQSCCSQAEEMPDIDYKLPKINLFHFVTMILLSWPYDNLDSLESFGSSTEAKTHAALSVQFIEEDLLALPANHPLQAEVKLLKIQLSTIFSYHCSVNN